MNCNCKICKQRIYKHQDNIQKFNHMIALSEINGGRRDDITPIGRSHTSCYLRLEAKINRLKTRIQKAKDKLQELGEMYM